MLSAKLRAYPGMSLIEHDHHSFCYRSSRGETSPEHVALVCEAVINAVGWRCSVRRGTHRQLVINEKKGGTKVQLK